MRTVPDLMAGAVTSYHRSRIQRTFMWDRNFQNALFGRLPQRMIILAEAKMHHGSRNSMGIHPGRIDKYIVPVIRRDLTPGAKG